MILFSFNKLQVQFLIIFQKLKPMKNLMLPLFGLFLMFSLSGCGLMEDAFKAGLIFGLIIIAIVGLLIWILRSVVRLLVKKGILQLSE
jgi:hypothetical protein